MLTWEQGAEQAADYILDGFAFGANSADELIDELKRTVRQLREDHFDQGRVKRWFFGALPFTHYMRRLAHLALDLADAELAQAEVAVDPTDAVRSITWLIARKQHDYGHGNITAFGERGLVVRINDKVERVANLWTRGGVNAVAGETLMDTLADVVGYALIGVMLDQGTFTLELEADAVSDVILSPDDFAEVFGEDAVAEVGPAVELETSAHFTVHPNGDVEQHLPQSSFQQWLNDLSTDELADWR